MTGCGGGSGGEAGSDSGCETGLASGSGLALASGFGAGMDSGLGGGEACGTGGRGPAGGGREGAGRSEPPSARARGGGFERGVLAARSGAGDRGLDHHGGRGGLEGGSAPREEQEVPGVKGASPGGCEGAFGDRYD